jgi:hypothetical protein
LWGCVVLFTSSGRQTVVSYKGYSSTSVKPNGLAGALQNSDWYRSLLAERLRGVLQSRQFIGFMTLALLIALFLPDICIILSIDSNLGTDIILSMVVLVFTFEFVSLTFVDANYLQSFFWWMDIIGTTSMIFDISFFLGTDQTAPRTSDGSAGKKNLMFLRAARAARLGARAGRLSRLLRMLKGMACLGSKDGEKQATRGTAIVISHQLANSVATRAAGLTMLLVMVIPLFDVMAFPQNDYSLQTWVTRLSISYKRKSHEGFLHEVQRMVDFFKDENYGPYTACHGNVTGDGSFLCREHITDWQPRLPEPPRLGSALFVHTDSLLIGFNMDGPIRFEAGLAILNILFIVVAMLGSGLALSSVVMDLAVRPLERMLLTVRQIASTVFKFSKEVEEEEEDEQELYDEGTSEMELLEKVVAKLAVVAELQTQKNMDRTEDMGDEDIGILSMIQGKSMTKLDEVDHKSHFSISVQGAGRKMQRMPAKALEDIGVSQEVYQSLAFNILPLSKNQRLSITFFTIAHFHAAGDGYIRTQDEKATLKSFINAAEKEYQPNPFHNFAHATDCVHMVARLLRSVGSHAFLSELEQFSLLIAGISHDLGHPGVNNGFLAEVGHEIALQYNDRSPLENMHCAKLYAIVGEENTNVFAKLSRDEYKEVRKNCIETILHTDMMTHPSIVKDLQMTYQMNTEAFTPVDSQGSEPRSAELDVFAQSDCKVLIMNTVLHSADISNPCRTWETASGWGYKVIEEFFAQGDEERKLGIPVQFLNDRHKLNKPNSQIGFIEFMIAPFCFAQIRLWPGLAELGDELVSNLSNWENMWVQEVSPSDEERQKVRSRVEKVTGNLEDAKRRGA